MHGLEAFVSNLRPFWNIWHGSRHSAMWKDSMVRWLVTSYRVLQFRILGLAQVRRGVFSMLWVNFVPVFELAFG